MERWTNEQNQILLKAVEDNPHNFQEAYRIAAATLGKSKESCRQHFEYYRRKGQLPVCMMTVGKNKAASQNRKNIHSRTGGSVEPVRLSKWRRILAILFE